MTREDALKILNTPDEEMDQLIAEAEKRDAESTREIKNVGIHILNKRQKLATVHKIVPTVPSPVVPMLILTNIVGYLMKNYLKTMIL